MTNQLHVMTYNLYQQEYSVQIQPPGWAFPKLVKFNTRVYANPRKAALTFAWEYEQATGIKINTSTI